jgi:hypothetical protein
MSAFEQKVAGTRPSADSFAPNNPQLPPNLKADCSRCAGLCCVAHAFYSVQGFAFDKPARTPCRHLTLDNRCGIHTQRVSRGFPACVGFDCYGAGQRVTQELCSGVNWRTSKQAAAQVFAAYTRYLVLHRLMATLVLAEAVLPPESDTLRRLRRAIADAERAPVAAIHEDGR